jgi:hypothetical protein
VWCRHELHRNQRSWVRFPPAAEVTVAQWQSIGQSRADYSRRKSCRDGAEKSYFVCQTTRGCGPATLIDYSSRLKIGRREPRTSRRLAPGLGKDAARDGGATVLIAPVHLARSKKLDVV